MKLSDEEINNRLKNWVRPEPKIKEGYLALYSQIVKSACKGAVVGLKL